MDFTEFRQRFEDDKEFRKRFAPEVDALCMELLGVLKAERIAELSALSETTTEVTAIEYRFPPKKSP